MRIDHRGCPLDQPPRHRVRVIGHHALDDIDPQDARVATGPTGGTYIQTDATKQTSVPNVFAAGDAALVMGSLPFAVADGAMAGIAAHRSLAFAV